MFPNAAQYFIFNSLTNIENLDKRGRSSIVMKTYKAKKLAHDEIENVHELCRLCLEKAEDKVAIFKDDKDLCAAIALRIMICIGYEVKDDCSLPNIICKACHEELDKYYKFRKKCQLSYQKLRFHAMAVKSKCSKKTKVSIDNEPVREIIEHLRPNIVDQIMKNGSKQMKEQSSAVLDTNTEKPSEIEKGQVPIKSEVNPDISQFLSSVLTELSIVGREQGLLRLQGVTTIELETGDGEELELELVEEDVKSSLLLEIAEEQSAPENINAEDTSDKKSCSEMEDNDNLFNVSFKKRESSRPWCSQCGRSFCSRSALARHARVHSGRRPHVCVVCGHAFTQKAVLNRHMLVHLDERPHRCSLCNKSFTQRGALEVHRRSHVPPHVRPLALHRCTMCQKVFLYASGLSRHMMTHFGRVFKCWKCDKQFKDRSSLLRHLNNVCPKGRERSGNTTRTGNKTNEI